MIKNLFFPDRIGTYYLFAQRIAAFEITKSAVIVTQVYFNAKTRIVEKCFEVPLKLGTAEDYAERVTQAISTAAAQIPKSTAIYACLPSSVATFKELRLPFIGREKINMVVAYEVEPLLPFALTDATIDFVITKELLEEKSSEILVVAVQNQYIAQYLAYFEAAGVQPEEITIDMVALYGLYRMVPSYAQKQGGVVLLEIEQHSTRMAYIRSGQLAAMRTINKGLAELTQSMSEKLHTEPTAIADYLMRIGLQEVENQEQNKIYHEIFESFIRDFSLTLQSFTGLGSSASSIETILLFGPCTTIKGLPELISNTLKTSCAIFNPSELLQTLPLTLKNKQNMIPKANLVTLGAALAPLTNTYFNLRKNNFALSEKKSIALNMIMGISLSLLLVGMVLAGCMIKVSRLKKESYASEQEVIDALKERFKKIPEDETALDDVVSAADKEIKQEERLWSVFSGSGRESILRYLLELTSLIDKNAVGLNLERLTISEDTMTLRGQVRGYEELKGLERDIRQSKLFAYVEPQTDPKFNMVIRLKKQGTR